MASKRDFTRARNVMRVDRGDSGQQLEEKGVTIVILRCSSCSKYTEIVVLFHIFLDYNNELIGAFE
jgi:hypothetical protein